MAQLPQKHQAVQFHPKDQGRAKTAARGYDAQHKRLRVLCFERDRWKCSDCGWQPEIVALCVEIGIDLPPTTVILHELSAAFARGERHLHADHQIPIEQRPDLRLELDNYRTRCDRCHNRKTMREQLASNQ